MVLGYQPVVDVSGSHYDDHLFTKPTEEINRAFMGDLQGAEGRVTEAFSGIQTPMPTIYRAHRED